MESKPDDPQKSFGRRLLFAVIVLNCFVCFLVAANLSKSRQKHNARVALKSDAPQVEAWYREVAVTSGVLVLFVLSTSWGAVMLWRMWQRRSRLEDQFRTIFNHSHDAIIIHNAQGAVIDINDRMLELYGLSREAAMQTTIAEISGPASPLAELPGIWKKVIADEKQLFEWEAKRPVDGRCFDVEVFLTRIDIGDEPVVLAAVRDISERKQAARELARREALYRSIFENSLMGIAITRADNTLIEVNPAFCKLLGYTREELVGRLTVTDVTHPEDITHSHTAISQLQSQELPAAVFEKRYITRQGNSVDTLAHVGIIRDDQGAYLGGMAAVLDISDRKRSQEQLQLAEFSIESSGLPTFWFDRESRVVRVNEAACHALGYTREELCALRLRDFDPNFPSVEHWEKTWRHIQQRRKYETIETLHRRKDGSVFPVEVSSSHINHGGKEYVYSFVRDISERKQAEAEKEHLQQQLVQAQKMEAVGRLAGGVAHDFNNMLSVISGYCELAQNKLSANDPLNRDLKEITKAANRSIDLTRQLLAFSRHQIIEPRPLNLNKIIAESERMLQRLVGEDIQIEFTPQTDLWPVNVDPSQIDQILANLTVNARDAMPDGGRITIATRNAPADSENGLTPIDLPGGEYVLLSIGDTGSGMAPEILEHIFEPFFTTKGEGKGTGLGLSTVYGIARQNGGSVSVSSTIGKGSVFRIYLPRHTGPIVEPAVKPASQSLTGQGTILVVEDDEQILELCQAFLTRFGYTVLTANKPGEAVIMCEKSQEPIHLLVSDVIMPTMNGKELGARIATLRPGIRILFMSGYTADTIAERGILSEGLNFIQKPFSMDAFLAKVKAILTE